MSESDVIGGGSLPGGGSEQSIGARIRQAREDRGFTQGAVANRTKMIDADRKGISRTALIGYEHGSSNPGLRELKLLCEVLRITPNWLIYGTETALNVAAANSELLNIPQMEMVLRTALAMSVLKGHERDALQSIALSMAGRQLGDLRLSGLLGLTHFMLEPFYEQLKPYVDDLTPEMSLADIAEKMSSDVRSNAGNKLKFDEEGNPVEGSWTYPDPKGTSKW